MVTPLIQLAIDFHVGKISAIDFAAKYLGMWDSKNRTLGQADKETGLVAAKIRTSCDDYYPGDDVELNEQDFRIQVKEYLAEIGLISK